MQDILIAVVDGLKGFPDALATAFPATTVQTRIVLLIRYSLSCASYQERKELAAALKRIYQAPNADAAMAALDAFEAADLGQRNPGVVRSWRLKWDQVISFMAFSAPIRRILYTTKVIESLNSSVRRAVKNRYVWSKHRHLFQRTRRRQVDLPRTVRSNPQMDRRTT